MREFFVCDFLIDLMFVSGFDFSVGDIVYEF
jgi:hypothetical protein